MHVTVYFIEWFSPPARRSLMTKSTVRCPYVKLAVLSWHVCAILGSPAEGAAPVLPLPTVNEDRGTEKDSDEDHLDGILDAMPPRARGRCPPSPADPQPLANAISVPCVIPGDMREKDMGQKHDGTFLRQEIKKRT